MTQRRRGGMRYTLCGELTLNFKTAGPPELERRGEGWMKGEDSMVDGVLRSWGNSVVIRSSSQGKDVM